MNEIEILYVPAQEPPVRLHINPGLAILQQLVGGDIESISGADWAAYLNGDGKVTGQRDNPAATELARALGWVYLPGDHLVGPVVFCGAVDEDGADTGVTQAVLDAAAKLGLL